MGGSPAINKLHACNASKRKRLIYDFNVTGVYGGIGLEPSVKALKERMSTLALHTDQSYCNLLTLEVNSDLEITFSADRELVLDDMG